MGFPDIVELERQKGKKVAVFPVGESDWMDMGQLSELEKMRIKLLSYEKQERTADFLNLQKSEISLPLIKIPPSSYL